MKKIFTIAFMVLSSVPFLFAQDFPGYRTGNYTGVNGVLYNPASIVGSPYRFDLSLFSMHALVGNDQASFKLNDLSESFDGDNLSDQIFGKDAGSANGLANIAVGLPSFMFNVGSKMSFAFTSRAKVVANINNMDGKLVKKITDDFENDPDLPYTIQSGDNMIVNLNGWTEFGLSVAREIRNEGGKKLKAGITIKYLAGAANSYLNLGNLNGTINADNVAQDAYLSNTTGRLEMGFGGVNFSDIDVGDLTKFNGSGIGADIGFVYELKQLGKGEVIDTKTTSSRPDYKLRLGVSLLDIGKISYSRDVQRSGAYNIVIDGADKYYFNNLEDLDLDSYKSKFNSQPQYFSPVAGSSDGKYSVSLPTTLQIDADYFVGKSLYVNAGGQIALSNNETTVYNSKTYSSFTVTPRIEMRGLGVFLPINYNALTQSNIGVGLRLGPLVVGSGSVISALTGSSKQADLFIGLHVGLLKKKVIDSSKA